MRDLLYVMYMGGPDSLDGIEEFLYNLFRDRDIIDFRIGSLQNPLAKLIAKRRSKKVRKDYEKMGGGSPQIKIMRRLLTKVSMKYEELYNRKLVCEMGMCYYHPYIEDTYGIVYDEFDRKVVMTMYPHYSYTTSGVCFKRLNNLLNIKTPEELLFKYYWFDDENYISCIIKRIKDASFKLGKELKECFLLFSAHSLPEYTLKKGDLYLKHVKENIKFITDRISIKGYRLSFQSRTGPIKWLSPETEDVLKEFFDEGIDNVIVVPISFVSDHIETLIELDEMYIKNVKEKGMNIVRVDSLNDSEDFAEAIAKMVGERWRN